MLRSTVLFALALGLLLAACAGPDTTQVATTGTEPPAVTAPPGDLPGHTAAPTTTTAPPTTTTVTVEPSTTTTMPPSTTAPPAPVVHTAVTPGGCSGMGDPAVDACWYRLYGCENGGHGWAANTGNGYYGGLQFSLSSWRAVGGTGLPSDHPAATQISLARRLWARAGSWSPWPGCSRSFGWL